MKSVDGEYGRGDGDRGVAVVVSRMDPKRRVTVSKFLSKHLRHSPEALGLVLGAGGWVEVEALLAACERAGFPISGEELEEVVATSDKQRFAFDPSGLLVRANQGHSTAVDLQLQPVAPPDVLYHGTAEAYLASILSTGLLKMRRHHVHLSAAVETARAVGIRHGRPVVLRVDSAQMREAGVAFYRSANSVWLVDEVPPRFLRIIDTE